MSKLISSRVPPSVPDKFNILCVGEAPGAEEAANGEPFIGKAGQLQQRYFERLGLRRSDIAYMNLCNYRPAENKFENCLGTDQLEEGVHEVREVIKKKKPNVVVALGAWPLFYLTGQCGTEKERPKPGSGIMLYRGSRLPMTDNPNQKVFATYHPSFVLRTWSWNPVFFHDLSKAVEDSQFPDFRYPEYDEYIDPPSDILATLVEEAKAAEWISLDIETFRGGEFSCVGFAYRNKTGRDIGVCITYQRPDLWRFAKEIWECNTPKILQYGTYDISFMRYFYRWKIGGYYNNVGWDTYVASASIYPDFPRRLDFLCSVYTRMPYYKEERKVWRKQNDMNILWKYNIKDTISTMLIAFEQMKDIGRLFNGK